MNEDYELWNVWGVITKYLDVVSLRQHQSVYLVFTQFSKMMRLGWDKNKFWISLAKMVLHIVGPAGRGFSALSTKHLLFQLTTPTQHHHCLDYS